MRKKPAKKPLLTNGMQTFTCHINDSNTRKMMTSLAKERESSPRFSLVGKLTPEAMSAETIAQGYLQHALASDTAKELNSPVIDDATSEFKSLGTEAIPLTGTKTVKFRQMIQKIPVYGSLVTVELDEKNELLGINSSVGTPDGIDPVAKISAADAVKTVSQHKSDFTPDLTGIVPRLYFYFDVAKSHWHLAFILEDVPVAPNKESKATGQGIPFLKSYVVDAQTGSLVAELNRTSTASASASGTDCLGATRTFRVEKKSAKAVLFDSTLNVETFDFKKKDPIIRSRSLPGSEITTPPTLSESAVSAHANASEVSKFLRETLMRNNIDGVGGMMKSSINCIVLSESEGGLGKEWINAFWNGRQMVYGLRLEGTKVLSLAANLEVVAHEMMHGVTDRSARLEYRFQSGALNESYSDIFGIIVRNFANPDPLSWDYTIGAGLAPGGQPFRNFADPTEFGQPDHMRNFVNSPDTPRGDNGGVHVNSGIHNKAAFNVLTAKKANQLVFTPKEVAILFYLALTQFLTMTSQFRDSRNAVVQAARTLFRNLPTAQLNARVSALEDAFTKVGIS